MSQRISRSVFNAIRKLASENPDISTREIARKLGISRDAAGRWRNIAHYPDESSQIRPQETISPVEQHHLKRENQLLRKELSELLDLQRKNDKFSEIAAAVSANPVKIPRWVSKTHKKGTDSAVPVIFGSDWHLDERVDIAQMGGMNAYDRKIAEIRLGNFFDNSVRLAKTFIGGVRYDGIYLLLGGDIFSGNIHEELRLTNEGTIIESVLYWTEPVASGIKYLADQFGHVHIPCVVGNHGRLTHKPVAKNRVQDNFDYLFYSMLAMTLKDDDRITWDIPLSADCRFQVYDCTFLFTHGDQFRGGAGVAGAIFPWLLGNARKLKAYTGMGKSYTHLVMGHWHQLTLGIQGIFVNGSLKGYDEYAMQSNFGFEPPQQALWLVQPRVGVTGRWPIHVLGEDESYGSL